MQKKSLDCMFSSATDMWETPQDFFDKLNAEFNFDVDVCAIAENAKCKNFYSPKENGLSKNWGGGTLVGAIHPTAERYQSGCKKHQKANVQQLCSCPLVPIQNGFTIISTAKQKSVLLKVD